MIKFSYNRMPARQEIVALIILVSLTMAPHLFHLNISIALFCTLILALRFFTLKSGKQRIHPFFLLLFTVAGLATVLLSYPYLTDQKSGVALLTVMLGLKILELNKKRDHQVALLACLFTLITQFLFDQSMSMTAYVILILIALVVQLQSINRHQSALFSTSSLKNALSMLLQAVPVAVVLFIFFPRFIGPLWNIGLETESATAGLNDTITPGSISNLIRSKAVAFRVEFKDDPPANRLRYWRGPVLWETDGYRWSRGLSEQIPAQKIPSSYTALDQAIEYEITLEPSNNSWLYALDLPAKIPTSSTLLSDFQITTNSPIKKRYQYQVSSHLYYKTGSLSENEKRKALQIPDNITPRMTTLVEMWQEKSKTSVELVNQGLSYFRKQPFYYTLRPPLLSDNPVDEFLFESKRGFCEHYATSFVTLMRIAGIPARIVAGYQGGELNPLGNYLIVRQSDAHAWAEVWLPNGGWVRTDPTSMVAPERIEKPFEFDLSDSLPLGSAVQFKLSKNDFLKDMLKQFSLAFDMVNTSWNQWILGYSKDRQNQMMELLGLDFLKGRYLGVGMVFGVMLALGAVMIIVWRNTKTGVEPIQRHYLRFCTRLAAKGIARKNSEGPADYLARVMLEHPEWGDAVNEIITNYIALRYQEQKDPDKLASFIRQVRNFRP